MSLTSVQICNIALTFLASNRISSLEAGDDKSATLNLLFQPLLDQIIEDQVTDWSFAIYRQPLAESTATNLTKFQYMYQLPVDPECLRPICLVDENGYDLDKELYPFKREGQYLYSDVEAVSLKYISQITDVTGLPRGFALYFAAVLAREVAFRITNDMTAANRMEIKADMLKKRAVWNNTEVDYVAETETSWTDL